jgi:hypothetical protein
VKEKSGIKRNSGRLHSVKIRNYMENGVLYLGLAIIIDTTRHQLNRRGLQNVRRPTKGRGTCIQLTTCFIALPGGSSFYNAILCFPIEYNVTEKTSRMPIEGGEVYELGTCSSYHMQPISVRPFPSGNGKVTEASRACAP